MSYNINSKKYLSRQELEYLTHRLKNNNSRDSVLIQLALATGARANELLNITYNDLDDSSHTVFIKGLKGSLDRSIPLDKALYNALKALGLNSNRIFDVGYSQLVNIWKQWTPNRHKSFKSLRHTVAMSLYRESKDILLVKTLLGHQSIENTMVYAAHEYETNQLKRILKYNKSC